MIEMVSEHRRAGGKKLIWLCYGQRVKALVGCVGNGKEEIEYKRQLKLNLVLSFHLWPP